MAKAGPDLLSRLKAIEGLRLDEAQLQKLFGRQEGMLAFRNIIKNQADFSASLGRQAEAQQTDLFGKILALPATDKGLHAAALARRGEAKKIEADRTLGQEQQVFEAVEAELYSQKGTWEKSARPWRTRPRA